MIDALIKAQEITHTHPLKSKSQGMIPRYRVGVGGAFPASLFAGESFTWTPAINDRPGWQLCFSEEPLETGGLIFSNLVFPPDAAQEKGGSVMIFELF